MRKQELVQLHTLCDAVRSHLEARRDVPPGTFCAYDETDVSPAAIHRHKRAHRDALDHLLDGLVAVADADHPPVKRDASPGSDE